MDDYTNGEKTRFKPGYSSSRQRGRPIGSRAKLSEAFLKDLHDLWQKEGPSILTAALSESPVSIVMAIVKLLPKEEKHQFVFSWSDKLQDAEDRLKLRKAVDDQRESGYTH